MTDLSDAAVDQLKRAVATPGDFDSFYPNTTDDDVLGALQDAFAECQLDGFFLTGFTVDLNAGTVDPDLTLAQIRLVVIYAAINIIRVELMNRKNKQHYQAGTAVSETETSSNILTAILKQLADQKQRILTQAYNYGAGRAFEMADAYVVRATDNYLGNGYVPDLYQAEYGWN